MLALSPPGSGGDTICCPQVTASTSTELLFTAVVDPSAKQAVVVVLNQSSDSVQFTLQESGQSAPLTIPGRAIQTLTFPLE